MKPVIVNHGVNPSLFKGFNIKKIPFDPYSGR